MTLHLLEIQNKHLDDIECHFWLCFMQVHWILETGLQSRVVCQLISGNSYLFDPSSGLSYFLTMVAQGCDKPRLTVFLKHFILSSCKEVVPKDL